MNEPVTKQRPPIDMEEFERFIRESATKQSRPGDEDPLAELARLVGHDTDPYGDVFAHQDEARRPSYGHETDYQQDATYNHAQTLPQAGAPVDPAGQQRRSSVDFAAIEAGLRGTLPAHQPNETNAAYADDDRHYYEQQGAAQAGEQYDWQPPAPVVAAPARSRRPVYAMAAVIVAGVVGIGVAFSYKGSNSGPREIAMIKAAPGPTKVQPPADEASDQPTRDASILDKAQQPAPTKTVAREEQPVDLAQSVQNAPRDVGNGITPIYNFGTSDGNASSVPVPPPPSQTQSMQKPADALGLASDIQPIRVKTRSYRPDGTPIPNDQPPAASVMDAMPPTVPSSKADKVAVAKASTPKVTTPKSTTRVAAPKPIVTADRGDESAPTDLSPSAAQPAHKAKPVKPVKPAKTAEPTDGTDATATTKATPTETTADTGNGGGFAVQLAAPGSEAEAKQASSRLGQKYASELGGHHLGFHKAVANGKSVFRVRVGSLTREEATEMCEKLKSSGGSCFVAKN